MLVLFRRIACAVVLLLLPACGGQQATGQSRDGAAFLREQLAALDRLAVPDGVQAADWAALKNGLREQLQAWLDSGKTALSVADSNASQSTLSLDTPNHMLSWRFYSQGDYDQNGETNINDLTPLGRHFHATTGNGTPFAVDSVESVVDGDGNGEINLSDLTPLGRNLGDQIQSYNIYVSTSTNDVPVTTTGANGAGAALLGSVPLSAGVGDPKQTRLSFSYDVGAILPGAVYWVRPNDAADGSGADGTPSVPAGPGAPPTASVELFQLDLERSDQTYSATDWGAVDVSFTGISGLLYFSMTFNGTEVLRNIPLISNRGAGLPHRISIPFSLGVASGTPVTAATVSYSIGIAPKSTSGARQTSAGEGTMAITGRQIGNLVEGASYTEPPPPATNSLGPFTLVSAYASQDFVFPSQECGKGEQAAAAVSSSLEYLRQRHSLDIGGDSGKDIDIVTMRQALGEEFEGGKYVGSPLNWPVNKDAFMQANGYPVVTTETHNFNEALNALNSGCDVEIVWVGTAGNHYTSPVTGMSVASDGTLSVQVEQDNRPGVPGGISTWALYDSQKYSPFLHLGTAKYVIERPVLPPAWHEQPLLDFAFAPSAVLLSANQLGLGYYHNKNDEQEFRFCMADWNGMTWTAGPEVAVSDDPARNFGGYNSLCKDALGNLHAAYSEEWPGHAVWYAKLPAMGALWDTPRLVEDTTGDAHGICIAAGGGVPCVSYFDSSQLRYARDDGAGGFAVVSPVSSSSFGNQPTKLLSANGMPLILFVNNVKLKAARANSADGLGTWTDLGNVLPDDLNQLYLDADLVGGRCAAVVCTSAGDMLYCRAAADDCSSWDAPVSCSGGVVGAIRPSLEVCTIGGANLPCISFTGSAVSGNRCHFIKALNTTGSLWNLVAEDVSNAAPGIFNIGQTSLTNRGPDKYDIITPGLAAGPQMESWW